MKLFFAIALILSASGVRSQEDACFTRSEFTTARAALASTCTAESVNILSESLEADVCALSPRSPCRRGLNATYSICGQQINEDFCFIQSIPTPSSSSEQCVDDATTTNEAALQRDCFGLEFTSIDQFRTICEGTTCRNLLMRIFGPCNYDPVTPTCANFPTTDPVTACFGRPENVAIFTQARAACQSENYNLENDLAMDGSFCRLQMGGACRMAIATVFRNCLPDGQNDLNTFCFLASIPTPSPTSEQCVDDATTANEAALQRDCFGLELTSIDQVRTICEGTACRNLLMRIFGPCNYDPVTPTCANLATFAPPIATLAAGSVKIYVIPVTVLLSALMSIFF